MTAIRFAVFGKSRLAAARSHALVAEDGADLIRTWSTEQAMALDEDGWRDALDPGVIDAAIFALPTDLAVKASLQALNAGINVLSELPGGTSVEDIVNLRAAERDGRAILKFGCSLRYHDSVREALKLVGSGDYGNLITARAVYGHAGYPGPDATLHGMLVGHGIHMLDLLHLFCGPFEAVKAMCEGETPGERNLFAILRSSRGALAQLHSSATSWRQTFRLELGYEKGYIWLDGHLPGLEGYGPEVLVQARLQFDEAGAPIANPDETVTPYETHTSAEDELREFIAAIRSEASLRHGTSHQAFDAMNIAQRICAATETWS